MPNQGSCSLFTFCDTIDTYSSPSLHLMGLLLLLFFLGNCLADNL